MKLTDDQAAAVKQVLGADPLPEDNPAMGELEKVFGEHSFYVGEDGLLVFEPAEEQADSGRLMLIAAWADEQKQGLQAVQPQPTDIVIDFSAQPGNGSDPAA